MTPFASRTIRIVLLLYVGLCLRGLPARGQDSGDQGTMSRGDRAELSITVRDTGGQIIVAPATVKLYKNGSPVDQASTSHGRAFFVPRSLGDFTIVVDATGYKSAQKDISLSVPIRAELDINLEREGEGYLSVGVPGKPVLAPKAKEALVKALKALSDNRLDEAQKHASEAMKLAPSNAEVLYVQGMVYMRRSNWAKAQDVLETANQLEPNQARVLAALGMALCNQKKYEEAIAPLAESLKLQPSGGWETKWALAKSYYYRERYPEALATAQEARTASHGSAPQVELLLAQCLTAMGRYEDSAEVLRAFLKANAGSPDAATARRWLDNLAADGKIRR